MNKTILTIAAGAFALAATQAQAAPTITYSTDPAGDITGYFGDSPKAASFDDLFAPFTIASPGTLTATLSTSGVFAQTDLDFITAEIVGTFGTIPFTLTKLPLTFGATTNPDGLEWGLISPISISGGTYQVHVTGTTTGALSAASFAGQLNVVLDSGSPTTPAPEPATWALMIAGFGAIGYAMRRQRLSYGRKMAIA